MAPICRCSPAAVAAQKREGGDTRALSQSRDPLPGTGKALRKVSDRSWATSASAVWWALRLHDVRGGWHAMLACVL